MAKVSSISKATLIERINRKLAIDRETSMAAQMTESPSFGHYYAVEDSDADDLDLNDLETLGRELGVLLPEESLLD